MEINIYLNYQQRYNHIIQFRQTYKYKNDLKKKAEYFYTLTKDYLQIHYHTAKSPLFKRQSEQELKRMRSEKDLRLRQNYIVNKDQIYTTLQNQFDQLANKPQFNRFISPKKIQYLPKNESIIAKQIIISHQTVDRVQQYNRSGGRRRVLFKKMRRPEHNSPMKRGVKQPDTQSSRVTEQVELQKIDNNQRKALNQNQQNSMMLKQLVTRMNQSKKRKIMSSSPYTARNNNIYYVTEVIKGYLNKQSLVRDHIFNSLYFLQLLEKYNNTTDFAADKPINLPQKPQYKDKITVVFDLDQTLVHCFQEMTQSHQVEIPVTFPGNYKMLAPLNIRPFAKEVLAELAKQFELMIFTASHQAYANAVVDYLDPQKQLIQHRLFRRHCDYIEQGYYIKDLRLLGRDLKKVVLVDNAAYSYGFQLNNGIPIIPFYNAETDYQLRALQQYLFSLKNCEDVRVRNFQTFKLIKYNGFTLVQELVESLYLQK